MALIEMSLILFSLACVMLAGAAGYLRPRWKLWGWVDPLYYALAIVAVILLFFSNERARVLTDLRAERAVVERRLQAQQNAKPQFQIQDVGTGSLKPGYDRLMAEADLGRNCAQALSTDMRCVLAREHGTLIASAFKGFQPTSTPARGLPAAQQLQDYCRRGFGLIDRLASSDGAVPIIFQKLKGSFAELGQKSLTPADGDITARYRRTFMDSLPGDGENFVARFPAPQQASVRDMWGVETSFAGNVYSAFEACLRIPQVEAAQLETMQRWQAEQTRQIAAKASVEKRLQDAQREPPPGTLHLFAAFIYGELWPFALVLALALKLGKGVAAWRP
jgi:hypothetical protein